MAQEIHKLIFCQVISNLDGNAADISFCTLFVCMKWEKNSSFVIISIRTLYKFTYKAKWFHYPLHSKSRWKSKSFIYKFVKRRESQKTWMSASLYETALPSIYIFIASKPVCQSLSMLHIDYDWIFCHKQGFSNDKKTLENKKKIAHLRWLISLVSFFFFRLPYKKKQLAIFGVDIEYIFFRFSELYRISDVTMEFIIALK